MFVAWPTGRRPIQQAPAVGLATSVAQIGDRNEAEPRLGKSAVPPGRLLGRRGFDPAFLEQQFKPQEPESDLVTGASAVGPPLEARPLEDLVDHRLAPGRHRAPLLRDRQAEDFRAAVRLPDPPEAAAQRVAGIGDVARPAVVLERLDLLPGVGVDEGLVSQVLRHDVWLAAILRPDQLQDRALEVLDVARVAVALDGAVKLTDR